MVVLNVIYALFTGRKKFRNKLCMIIWIPKIYIINRNLLMRNNCLILLGNLKDFLSYLYYFVKFIFD